MISIERYRRRDGKEPFTDWLHKIRDAPTRARILTRLDRVSAGNFGDCKLVRGGVYELRVDIGPGYRVYYGLVDKALVLLLAGGSKRTQDSDIDRAIEYWHDFRQRAI